MNSIKFTSQQEEAMRLIGRWYRQERGRPFILNGYAGCGKTTVAKYISEKIGIGSDEVIYIAYTGKAALQLRKKGCEDATTIHKLLYKPVLKDKERLHEMMRNRDKLIVNSHEYKKICSDIMKEKQRLRELSFESRPDEARIAKSRLVVVDESSMINEKIASDLSRIGLPIIYCGDPFQLPPIKGDSPVARMQPNMFLTDVVRQALDNPILRLATNLRQEKYFSYSPINEVNGDMSLKIIPMSNPDYEIYEDHDQVICGTHKSRYTLNRNLRSRRIGRGEIKENDRFLVAKGDKIIFGANHDDISIFNGSIGILDEISESETTKVYKDHNGKIEKIDKDFLLISGETAETKFEDYDVWGGMLKVLKKPDDAPICQNIDYSYAITCHRSQGSEWDSVLVHYDPWWPEMRNRWIYTALTRAAKRCTIVVPGRSHD